MATGGNGERPLWVRLAGFLQQFDVDSKAVETGPCGSAGVGADRVARRFTAQWGTVPPLEGATHHGRNAGTEVSGEHDGQQRTRRNRKKAWWRRSN